MKIKIAWYHPLDCVQTILNCIRGQNSRLGNYAMVADGFVQERCAQPSAAILLFDHLNCLWSFIFSYLRLGKYKRLFLHICTANHKNVVLLLYNPHYTGLLVGGNLALEHHSSILRSWISLSFKQCVYLDQLFLFRGDVFCNHFQLNIRNDSVQKRGLTCKKWHHFFWISRYLIKLVQIWVQKCMLIII